ncbi:MAG: hypothetical protein ACRDJH_00655 [Thermomicrobiales bacterium]
MNEEYKSTNLPSRDRWAEGYELHTKAMRDAGRWVIGVVAGILLAATNLSGFGRLYPDQWRYWLAVVSAVVSVGTIGKIIHLFLHVQVGEELNWEKLTSEHFAFVREYGFLKDYSTFIEFRNDHLNTLTEYAAVRSSIGATHLLFSPQQNHDLLNRQKILSDKLEAMVWEQRDVEALLGWLPVKERFGRARSLLLWLGAIAAVATMTLVWAVNGPEPQSQTVVVLPPVSSPQGTP